MSRDESAPAAKRTAVGRWLGAVRHELRTHAMAYGVLVVFAAAGPLIVSWLFPGVSPWVGLAGGLALGIYAALCAVPGHFYE